MKQISVAVFLVCFGLTIGHSRYRGRIPNGYGVNHPCPGKGHWDAVGHMNGGYTPEKNPFGQDFSRGGHRWTVELCQKDSDGDGLTNGEELGDPQCKWGGRGDQPTTPAKGHPGFCERDRRQCSSGTTHAECPNPRAAGQGQRPTSPPRRLPTGANDHPQTFLSKNMGQGQSFGPQQPGFGFQSFGRSRGMSPGPPAPRLQPQQTGTASASASSRSRSGSFDRSFSGIPQSGGQSFGSELFRPPVSGSDGRFRSQGLSRDFGMTGSRFIGVQPFGVSGGGSGTSLRGEMGDRSMMSSPGMDRFTSSLDQRTIQGIGSSRIGSSFTSPISQGEIERSVQARMERERSRFGGMGPGTRGMSGMSPGFPSSGMRSGAFSPSGMTSGGMGTASMGHMRSGGMGSGGLGPGVLGPMGSGSIGSAGTMRTMGSGFSRGMGDSFAPFMTSGSSGFSGHSFSGGGSAVGGGPGMSGGMSMHGVPGMSRGPGPMMPPGYPRF